MGDNDERESQTEPAMDGDSDAKDGTAKAHDVPRDEKGRILPGRSLNPKGRPKGRGFMDKLKERLKEQVEVMQTDPETGEKVIIKVQAIDVVVDNFVKELVQGKSNFHLREYLDREAPKPKRIDIVTTGDTGPKILRMPAGGMAQAIGLTDDEGEENA